MLFNILSRAHPPQVHNSESFGHDNDEDLMLRVNADNKNLASLTSLVNTLAAAAARQFDVIW